MSDLFRYEGDDWLESHLFDRRVVVLRGPLDGHAATRVASKLMTLDATSDDPVQLQVDSGGGALEAGFAVIDVIDAMGVTVEVVCMGRVEGTAVAVAAVCGRRAALAHAQFRLVDPDVELSGRACELEALVAHHEGALARFHERLAQATGRSAEAVEDACRKGLYLSAEEALGYGIVDKIIDRRRAIRPLRS